MRRGENYTTPSANRKCRTKIILKPTNYMLLDETRTDKPQALSEVFKYVLKLRGVSGR